MSKREDKRRENEGRRRSRKRARDDFVKRTKCFWTWPFGHVWKTAPDWPGSAHMEECKYCPAKKYPTGEQ